MTGQSAARGHFSSARGVLVLAVLAAGCGQLNFIPSPFTPQDVELIYSAQEHITVVRWWMNATAPVEQTRFELLDDSGHYNQIDFAQSVFAGGVAPCKDGRGSCAQYVVRGNYMVGPGARPVQAVHDVYGVLPGSIAATETVSETISFKSFFKPGNDVVYVNITDAVANQGPYSFPRPFEHGMWATNGLCVSDAAPDDVSFSPVDSTGGFPPPQPLTDEGIYCVGTRPIPADQAESTLLQTRIATLPEIVTNRQTYAPPIERAPIIYQIILDLEIPVPDRCTDAIKKIEDLLQKYFSRVGVPVHQLPTINLANDPAAPCAQTNDRVVKPTEIAQAVKQLVTTLPEYHQQYHFMYFNNLDAPQPFALKSSFRQLFDSFAAPPGDHDLKIFSWMFSPLTVAAASADVKWWAFWVWQTPDMNFEMKMADYVQQNLPYTSQEHDQSEPVPLLSKEDVSAYEGSQIKICYSTPPVQPFAQLPSPHAIFDASWKITAADPPAYLVSLDNKVVVAGSSFIESDASINYQICTRYCHEHPFIDTAGMGQLSWDDNINCAKESF
jgi:hypothetical protein